MSIAEKLATIAANEARVYEAGRKEVWDAIQYNGKRTNYSYGFYCPNSNNPIWNDDTFKPMYDIVPKYANRTFRGIGVTDMPALLNKCGVKLDFSKCTTWDYLFAESKFLTRVGDVVIALIPDGLHDEIIGTFAHCPALTTIDSIEFCTEDETHGFDLSTMFKGASSLKHITFKGAICDTLNFQWSPLTVESMKNIISKLSDIAMLGTYFPEIIFSDKCWAALEAEGATAPNDLTWREYAEFKGWST